MRVRCHKGEIAVAHNGNLVNADRLRANLENDGSIFTSSSDTEVILHLIARSHQRSIEDAIVDALGQVKGAYSLAFLTNDRLVGVRDPMGFRPLSIGRLDDSYVITSETTALDLVGATFVRDIEPVRCPDRGAEIKSFNPFAGRAARLCFEYVYSPGRPALGAQCVPVRSVSGWSWLRKTADADSWCVPDSGARRRWVFAVPSPESRTTRSGSHH